MADDPEVALSTITVKRILQEDGQYAVTYHVEGDADVLNCLGMLEFAKHSIWEDNA
jgi:hypothetical protein